VDKPSGELKNELGIIQTTKGEEIHIYATLHDDGILDTVRVLS